MNTIKYEKNKLNNSDIKKNRQINITVDGGDSVEH